MIIDSTHRRWLLVVAILTVVGIATYIPYALWSPNGPSGGSAPGMIYGVLASLLMIYAGLLNLRKRLPTWPIGSAQTWLRGHIWLSLLSFPLLLFHAGFRWGGMLEITLWLVYAVVMISGVIGLLVQQQIPRAITNQVPSETIFEQIPHVCALLQAESDILLSAYCGPLEVSPSSFVTRKWDPVRSTKRKGSTDGDSSVKKFQAGILSAGKTVADKLDHRVYLDELRPDAAEDEEYLEAAPAAAVVGSEPLKEFYTSQLRAYLAPEGGSGELATREGAQKAFARLRLRFPAPSALANVVDRLEKTYEFRRELAVQERLHLYLHGWLLIHVPFSMALLVLGVAHAISAVYY